MIDPAPLSPIAIAALTAVLAIALVAMGTAIQRMSREGRPDRKRD